MTSRERFLACMKYEPVDHVPDMEFGGWEDLFEEWHEQGLPLEVKGNAEFDEHFGLETLHGCGGVTGLIPAFETEVLEEDETTRVVRDGNGIICRVRKHGSSIPQYLEFPVKNREDWERIKFRLDPTNPARIVSDWEERTAVCNASDRAVAFGCGGFYGWLRNFWGLENLSIAFFEQRDLVEEMLDTQLELVMVALRQVPEELRIDLGTWWEDMCYNHGPLMSPQLFRELLMPRYKVITEELARRGVWIHQLDSDGNIRELTPLWLEVGINLMFPVEVAAGSDPCWLREHYGREVLLRGGYDKLALLNGREAIVRELERIAPVVEEGGFIPHVDHRVPADVKLDDYHFYLEKKREMFGIPRPE